MSNRNVFGWSYPPGAANDPNAPYNQIDEEFVCPHCGSELYKVRIITKCWMSADINANGEITSYNEIEEILDIPTIECPECGEDIANLIKQ